MKSDSEPRELIPADTDNLLKQLHELQSKRATSPREPAVNK